MRPVVRITAAVTLIASLAACSAQDDAPAPAEPTTATQYPVRVTDVTATVIATGPADGFTAAPGDERGDAIPDGASVVAVTVTLENTGTEPVALPDYAADQLRVRYGPTAVDADIIAAPATYHAPHRVPAAGTADLQLLFVIPTDDIVGSTVTTTIPDLEVMGTADPGYQSATIGKVTK